MSVFGVDFGCRNLVVSATRHNGFDIICNEVSKRETAAYVSLGDEQRWIGESGLDKAVRAASNTVANLKRFIGMRATDPRLKRELEFVYAPTTTDSEGRVQFEMSYHGETVALYPEQCLAMLLTQLRSYVSIECKVDFASVRDCVLSVPAWYTAEQRKLVIQAADIAGLNCMSVVNENTASVIDYGIFREKELPESEDAAQVVGLVDIGYGATTVTVFKAWKGNAKVLAVEWDESLGTRDIDYMLMQHFAVEIQKKYKVDVLSSRRPMIRVLQACEKVKNMLSANAVAPLNIECIMDVDVNFNAFDRTQLEAIMEPLVQRMTALCKKAVAAAGVDTAKMTAVELIGGGCRVPSFKAAVQTVFGHAPRFTLNASESVARGCGVTAAVFSPRFRVREFVVADKPLAAVSLGLHSASPATPVQVACAPDVTEKIAVVSVGQSYPKVEEVTVDRSASFDAWLFYDEQDPHAVAVTGGGKHMLISKYAIGLPSGKTLSGQVKLAVRVPPSGIPFIEAAWTQESYEVEEVVPAAKAAEGADSAAAPAETRVKKTRTRRVDLAVSTQGAPLGFTSDFIAKAAKQEADMNASDAKFRRTKEEKNALEGYIFEVRPRLESGGILHDFAEADARSNFVALCNKFEEWLGEDGSDSTLEEYTKRLGQLREVGEPAARRHKNFEDMPFNCGQFEKELTKQQQRVKDTRGKHAHITDADLDGAAAKVDDAMKWARQQLDALKAAPKTAEPTFTHASLDARLKEVTAAVTAVVTKKAPPPPKKEEPKKDDAAAEAAPPPTDSAAPETPSSPPKNADLD